MTWEQILSLWIGRIVLVSGGLMLLMVLVMLVADYLWRRLMALNLFRKVFTDYVHLRDAERGAGSPPM